MSQIWKQVFRSRSSPNATAHKAAGQVASSVHRSRIIGLPSEIKAKLGMGRAFYLFELLRKSPRVSWAGAEQMGGKCGHGAPFTSHMSCGPCYGSEIEKRKCFPSLSQLLYLSLFYVLCCVHAKCFSRIWLFVTVSTVAHQAPLSRGFSRQEYWNGLPCPPPGNLPDPGVKAASHISCIGRQILYL